MTDDVAGAAKLCLIRHLLALEFTVLAGEARFREWHTHFRSGATSTAPAEFWLCDHRMCTPPQRLPPLPLGRCDCAEIL
jgi:hypothetical protein